MLGAKRNRLQHALFAGCALVVLLLALWQSERQQHVQARVLEQSPVEQTEIGYTSSNTCRACHPGAYDTWAHSYHRTMTKPASAEFVRAPFDGVNLEQAGQVFELHAENGRYQVTVHPSAADRLGQGFTRTDAYPTGTWDISLVTGSHHMQIFWYASGHGRTLGQLPFAFLLADRKWVPREMIFLQPPSIGAANELGRWNDTCIHCHTTRGKPLPQQDGDYASQVNEFGIACEACHGPAAEHVAQLSAPTTRYARMLGLHMDLKIQNPKRLSAQRGSQICSQCHALWLFDQAGSAQWAKTGMTYQPGDDPKASMWLFAPSEADSDPRVRYVLNRSPQYARGQYWGDGQARVSGREYNGMRDSACFAGEELSCTSCHEMHKAPSDPRSKHAWADDQLIHDRKADGACLQCHQEYKKNTYAHTQHVATSSGSRCQNCHMPYSSYGLLKAIRSHKITIPSSDETIDTGRPNACNLCHLDRSLGWTARMLQTRFNLPQQRDPSVRLDADVAQGAALALQGDAGQRALTAWALGWSAARAAANDAWMPPLLGILMDDPYDAVRYVAGRSLSTYPAFADFEYDFTIRPEQRTPVADAVAARHAEASMRPEAADPPLTERIPLTASGSLNAVGERLLSTRDHTPVHLLE